MKTLAKSQIIMPLQQKKLDVEQRLLIVVACLLFMAIIARMFVAFRYEINWDEFYYLSFVYKFLNNNVINTLQTFHVHFFTWVEWVSKNEVNQIIAARFFMVLMQLVTGLFIYRICRRNLSVSAALFAVLSYFSVSYVMRTGASFRSDPIATFCLMASLDLILVKASTIKHWVTAGVLIALALIVTVKSALYFPTFGLMVIVMIIGSENRKDYLWRAFVLFFSVAIAFSIFYLYHGASISVVDASRDIATMSHSFDKTINHNVVFPRKDFLFNSFMFDIAYWLALVYGLKIIVLAIWKQQIFTRNSAIIIAALILPLTSVLFYRNAFPYFYSFMLAPASILCGVAWGALPWKKNTKEAVGVSSLILFFMLLSIIRNGFVIPQIKNLDRQHQLIDVVHKAFPNPVSYFDRCSMISSYPQKGLFMSTWGIDNYTGAGKPVLDQTIRSNHPVFFIANIGSLDVRNQTPMLKSRAYALLDPDTQAIKDNYIHHWGELYVAGKQINLTEGKLEANFSIVIDGSYTLEGASKAIIDGQEINPGQTIFLTRDTHTIRATEQSGMYTLRWGKHLYLPSYLPEERPIFNGF